MRNLSVLPFEHLKGDVSLSCGGNTALSVEGTTTR